MRDQTTTTTLPSKNETHGYLATLISNGSTEGKAKRSYGDLFTRIDQDYDFGPLAIRRILDSRAGRHLADGSSSPAGAFELFHRWMRGRTFKEEILAICCDTDENFYGE